MRPRFVARTLCLLLLATGLSIGQERSNPSGRERSGTEERYRVVSGQDCSFGKDPESYLLGLRRHIEAISVRTERFAAQVGDKARVSDEKYSIFVNDVPRRSYIDNYIFDKMQADNVPHAPLSSDSEFMRRVSLDLTGRIPSADQVRQFLGDDDPQKRSNLIDSLIGIGEYTSKWSMYFGDLLKNNANDTFVNRYNEGRNAFHWSIRSFVEGNVPYDVFVRKLLTATGNSFAEGEANWTVGCRTPMGPAQDTYDTLAVRAATQFLGMNTLDCLMCHSGAGHLDKLNVSASKMTRTQAWEMSAFFSRFRSTGVTISQNPQLIYYMVSDVTGGDYPLNTTAGNRTPRQPVSGVNQIRPRYLSNGAQPATGSNYREAFADNLVSDRQFARATVNYLWKELMGMGIVEPADQFDLARLDSAPSGWTLQPSHPELLEALTDDFIRSGYDIRTILKTIANSSAYQLSSRFTGAWHEAYTPYFARKFVRRLDAEEVHDAITMATGILANYTVAGIPNVVWAMDFPDTQEPRSNGGVQQFLNYFLRGNRDTNLRSDEGTILQSLNMMNNTFVLNRIRNSNANTSVARALANKELSDAGVVEQLFLATLNRFPSAKELSLGTAALRTNRVTGAEDLQWTLLNKVDFLYNY